MRPRGKPPIPSAASTAIEPVEITETGTMASFDPSRRIDPLPNCFSIWPSASSKARARSLSSMMEKLLLLGGGELNYNLAQAFLPGVSSSDVHFEGMQVPYGPQ